MSESARTLAAQPSKRATGSESRVRSLLARLRVMPTTASMVGVVILLILILLAVLAPMLGLQDPYLVNVRDRLQPPSVEHWFGTDHYGRDLLSRVIFGTRSSLLVAVVSVGVALAGGLFLGLVAGYFGGAADGIIMRITEILMAFPSILLGMGLIAALGPSLVNIIIVIMIVRLPTLVRLVRADTLVIRRLDFVEASKSLGASESLVLIRHVLPNTLPSLIVMGAVGMAQAVILEAAFGFLGLGVQPPTPSWGNLLADGREYMRVAPYTSIFPGLFVMILAISFNLIGDGLRDLLDPRTRSGKADIL